MCILDCRRVLRVASEQRLGFDSPSRLTKELNCGRTIATQILSGGPNPLASVYPLHKVSEKLLDRLAVVLCKPKQQLLASQICSLTLLPSQQSALEVYMELTNDCVVWRDAKGDHQLHLKLLGKTPVALMKMNSRSAILIGSLGKLHFVGWQLGDDGHAAGAPIQLRVAIPAMERPVPVGNQQKRSLKLCIE